MNETKAEKSQFWLNHIEAANSSGLSITQYAKLHGIKAQSLYQWRNKIKSKTNTNTNTPNKKGMFTRVVSPAPSSQTMITLRLREATLEFSSLPEPRWLSTLLLQVSERQ